MFRNDSEATTIYHKHSYASVKLLVLYVGMHPATNQLQSILDTDIVK